MARLMLLQRSATRLPTPSSLRAFPRADCLRLFSSSSSSSSSSIATSAAHADGRPSARASVRALIIGSPGSGKGTLSKRLLRVMPTLQYLSAGDMLRAERQAGTPLGKEADAVMRAGTLMPDETMMGIVSAQVQQLASGASQSLSTSTSSATPSLLQQQNGPAWLLDGFPRTKRQAELFDAALHRRGHALNLVLHLDVPRDIVMARILERWIHEPSGRTYNLSFNPPKIVGKDDLTGEPLVKRIDDDADTFTARLQSYESLTAPMVRYFADQNAPALDTLDHGNVYVRLQGNTSDEIWPRMLRVVQSRYGGAVKQDAS